MGNQVGGRRRRAAVDDRYTAPQGLYPHPDIDLRKLRRLILEAKLAPCHPGADDPRPDLDECPICFLVSTPRPPISSWIELFMPTIIMMTPLCDYSVLSQSEPVQVLRQGDLHR